MDDYKDKQGLLDEELLAEVASYVEKKHCLYRKYQERYEGEAKSLPAEKADFAPFLDNLDTMANFTLEDKLPTTSCEGSTFDKILLHDGDCWKKAVKNAYGDSFGVDIGDEKLLDELFKTLHKPEKPTPDKQSFSRKFYEYLLVKNLYPVDIYGPLGMNRQLISKILNDAEYHPSKETVISICMALKLNLKEFKDLLARADYGINPHSDFDSAIEYFVKKGFYDLPRIDAVLHKLNLPMICKYK